MKSYKYILSIALLLSYTKAFCQISDQPNIDFEFGNTSVWNYYIGTCCPIATPISTPALNDRHTITTAGTIVDPYGQFPVVCASCGKYSMKLGNDSIGAQAEKARYYIHVPPGITNYSIIYHYAVVFEDPGHLPSQQPRFEIIAFDSVSGIPVPCAQYSYVASSNLPGFMHSTNIDSISDVFYKDWSMGSINLTGYEGKTITLDFSTGDCSLGGHFGYAYIDMSSGLFAISTVSCDSDKVTLAGPEGYKQYYWYDSMSCPEIG